MPRQVADVLNHPDHRRLQLVLNTEAELSYSRRLVGLSKVGETRRKEWSRSRQSCYPAGARVREVDVAALGLKAKAGWWQRCKCRCPACARRRFRSRRGERFCRYRTCLQRSRRVAAVCRSRSDQALRESVLARESHAVQIERNSVDGLESRSGRIQRVVGVPNRSLARQVGRWVEVGDRVAALPCVRQSVITKSDLQRQPRRYVPVIHYVRGRSLVHIVPDGSRLVSGRAARQTHQHVHEAVVRELSLTHVTLGIAEELLVLGIAVVAEAILHGVLAHGVRNIDLGLVIFSCVVPWCGSHIFGRVVRSTEAGNASADTGCPS